MCLKLATACVFFGCVIHLSGAKLKSSSEDPDSTIPHGPRQQLTPVERYVVLNNRLWERKVLTLSVYTLILFALFIVIFFCIGKLCLAGNVCRTCMKQYWMEVLKTFDKCTGRDPDYRDFCVQMKQLGIEPPPYQHYKDFKSIVLDKAGWNY